MATVEACTNTCTCTFKSDVEGALYVYTLGSDMCGLPAKGCTTMYFAMSVRLLEVVVSIASVHEHSCILKIRLN